LLLDYLGEITISSFGICNIRNNSFKNHIMDYKRQNKESCNLLQNVKKLIIIRE